MPAAALRNVQPFLTLSGGTSAADSERTTARHTQPV